MNELNLTMQPHIKMFFKKKITIFYFSIIILIIIFVFSLNAKSTESECNNCSDLQKAVYMDNYERVKYLLDNGSDPNEKSRIGNGQRIIYLSIYKKNYKITKLLIEKGAILNTDEKFTTLHQAVESGNILICKLLLLNKSNINILDQNFETPLHISSRKGNYDIFKLLLNNGADIFIQDKLGDTVFQKAVIGGNIEIVKLLIKKGANIDKGNSEGFTPLMESVYYRHKEIAKLLLDYHADINQVIKEKKCDWNKLNYNICFDKGDTARKIALKIGNTEFLKLLEDCKR